MMRVLWWSGLGRIVPYRCNIMAIFCFGVPAYDRFAAFAESRIDGHALFSRFDAPKGSRARMRVTLAHSSAPLQTAPEALMRPAKMFADVDAPAC